MPNLEQHNIHVPITVVTDCADPNALMRLAQRNAALFGQSQISVGLGNRSPGLEAAGHVVDAIAAFQLPEYFGGQDQVIEVNVAPRGSEVKRRGHSNGTPFCHAQIGRTSLFCTLEGSTLPALHELGLVDEVDVFDISTVTEYLADERILTSGEKAEIDESQFRSLLFLPLAAYLTASKVLLPCTPQKIEPVADIRRRAWYFDKFGNIKTLFTSDEIGDFEDGTTVRLAGGQKAQCFNHLADVPSGQLAITIGSSGLPDKHCVEVVVGKGRAQDRLGIKRGKKVLGREFEELQAA